MKTPATKPLAAALTIALAGGAGVAHASDSIVRVGGHYADPKSDNHAIVNIDAGQSLTFNATYLFSEHWGIELLAALLSATTPTSTAMGRGLGSPSSFRLRSACSITSCRTDACAPMPAWA